MKGATPPEGVAVALPSQAPKQLTPGPEEFIEAEIEAIIEVFKIFIQPLLSVIVIV